jgi:hypothetical protein
VPRDVRYVLWRHKRVAATAATPRNDRSRGQLAVPERCRLVRPGPVPRLQQRRVHSRRMPRHPAAHPERLVPSDVRQRYRRPIRLAAAAAAATVATFVIATAATATAVAVASATAAPRRDFGRV